MLELDGVSHAYEDAPVLDDLSMRLEHGQIGCVLGPSGCGKTTLLRCIAGFEPITAGRICIDGHEESTARSVNPPERRKVGMVFQDYALLPHLNVIDNVAFGLHAMPTAQRGQHAMDTLDTVGLTELAQRFPHEISGGQQQRVAIARALAPAPALVLMDEPFSNIDAGMRSDLGKELSDLFRSLGTTVLVVTHDHSDAFSMADKLGVLCQGKLLQWDDAYRVYHEPATRFVADFVGRGEWLPGILLADGRVETSLGVIHGNMSAEIAAGTRVDLLLRPDDVVHDDSSTLLAEVISRRFLGSEFLYELRIASGDKVTASVPSHHDHSIGEKIGIRIETEHMVVFPSRST